MSIPNFKNGGNVFFKEFHLFLFLKMEIPPGIADLTASTALDTVPHSLL